MHRLIERLGLRRQQLFAAQADVVERLRALARFGELAAALRRAASPQAHAARVRALDRRGRRLRRCASRRSPSLRTGADARSRSLARRTAAAGGLEVDHVYVLGPARRARGSRALDPSAIPDALLREQLPADDEARPRRASCASGCTWRSRARAGRPCSPIRAPSDRGARARAVAARRARSRGARPATGRTCEEELFGPAETLHSTYRLLRDELLEGTMRAGGRLGELRFDTDLDVSHAVVRYLELLKLAALIARRERPVSVAEALRDVNARIAAGGHRRAARDLPSSPLDDYLLDAERDARRRAQAVAARDEPSLEPFLPLRGDGVVLSATDIDTYRTCPLKYKFARVFRIPQEPTLHQRFGILVHQVLERFHAGTGEDEPGRLAASCSGCSTPGWRRGGFGDSEEERQLRGKAAAALTRYHERASSPRTASRSGSSASSRSSSGRTCCAGASTASTGCPAASTS